MNERQGSRVEERPMSIECLVCHAVRVVAAPANGGAGNCPRCGYAGWTYAEDLDSTALRTVTDG